MPVGGSESCPPRSVQACLGPGPKLGPALAVS